MHMKIELELKKQEQHSSKLETLLRGVESRTLTEATIKHLGAFEI